MNNADQPIKPITGIYEDQKLMCIGLTKKEYYAGLAMQGLIASCDWKVSKLNNSLILATSENAVKIADELLKQLEK